MYEVTLIMHWEFSYSTFEFSPAFVRATWTVEHCDGAPVNAEPIGGSEVII